MRISDWSSDVCSSDLAGCLLQAVDAEAGNRRHAVAADHQRRLEPRQAVDQPAAQQGGRQVAAALDEEAGDAAGAEQREVGVERDMAVGVGRHLRHLDRSEEHTSELQSLMRISYAVFCLKKKNKTY